VKESEQFEQQIHRIHELLDGSGATVIWDDRIADPDNPSRARQIDITIRRNGKVTIVECRQHRSPQDVQWIEELIGRRVSLRADGVIAVSSSGFTAGALRKASAHGIILRDLQDLTEAEVKVWGRQVALTLYFYQYSDLEVSLCFERNSIHKLDNDVVASELKTHPAMQSLFEAAAQQLGTINLLA
jgi:Restriction endonuclease